MVAKIAPRGRGGRERHRGQPEPSLSAWAAARSSLAGAAASTARTRTGRTSTAHAQFLACENGHFDVALFLVQGLRRRNITRAQALRKNAAPRGVLRGHLELCKMLLAFGAMLIEDEDGDTPCKTPERGPRGDRRAHHGAQDCRQMPPRAGSSRRLGRSLRQRVGPRLEMRRMANIGDAVERPVAERPATTPASKRAAGQCIRFRAYIFGHLGRIRLDHLQHLGPSWRACARMRALHDLAVAYGSFSMVLAAAVRLAEASAIERAPSALERFRISSGSARNDKVSHLRGAPLAATELGHAPREHHLRGQAACHRWAALSSEHMEA